MDNDFGSAVESAVNSLKKRYGKVLVGTVDEVDENTFLCTVTTSEGKFNNISLMFREPINTQNPTPYEDEVFNSYVVIPKIGSTVRIMTEYLAMGGYVIECASPSKIYIGDNSVEDEEFYLTIDFENKTLSFLNGDMSFEYNPDDISIKKNTTEIFIEDGDIKITGDKVYINDDTETEPVVRGNENKSKLDSLYDFVVDIYNKILTHTHGTAVGPSTPPLPPVITQIPTKIVEAQSDKATTNQTLSTKNFTE